MNDMEIVRVDSREFFLFLDIFMHWSGKKITAVAPCYGDDIDWTEHGVDMEDVVLTVGGHRVRARYLPHRLDSWEPCILFDFEAPVLEAHLSERDSIAFTINAGRHSRDFVLDKAPAPGHHIAMSLIVRDCNRWLHYFLDYHLDCLDCDHVYLYDNNTSDQQGLQRIIQSYADRGQLTYIPWHYRWKNTVDGKQIGQIPQQTHSLNKFGRCDWIGFFDYDEFLRIPGKTLKQFLRDYDPGEVDGLSFGLRWFMNRGTETLEEIGNPLLNLFDAKRDQLGRKRQKLIVSPRDVRFLRIHWLEDGKKEVPVDDTNIYFHHYYLNPDRFQKGKSEPGTHRDDFMLGHVEPLIRAAGQSAPVVESTEIASAGHRLPPRPRTAEQWIAHVMGAFDTAEAEGSKLSQAVLELEGLCGRRNRHFFNALCAFDGCRYLEIGSHKGASLCAAMHGNELSAVAIDNWSEFGGPRADFMAVTAKHRGSCELRVIEQDCFTVDPGELGPIDVYFYDSGHGAHNHARAIEHFYGCLDDRAVVVIDDWNWDGVRAGTREAMEKLDIPIIFEKEIFVPVADVEGMPHHRGRDTWWNGIYVMIVDKQAAPLSLGTRPRTVSISGDRGPGARLPLEVIVFSKDRACQLEALLRSMDRFFEYPHRVRVLFKASNRAFRLGYEALKRRYRSVTWVEETDFRRDLRRQIGSASVGNARNVMFLVDDIVFTRRFSGEGMIELLEEDDDILALSLRLGDKIHFCHPRGMATRPPAFLEGGRWTWRDAEPGYWNYPMSVDGNIYRLSDIAEMLAQIDFRNPNTLEARMAGQPINRPLMVCHSTPYLVNLALNLVQDVFDNPHAGVPVESLNQCFLNGFGIDIDAFAGREFSACHIEPKIALIPLPQSKHARSTNSAASDQYEPSIEVAVSLAGEPGPVIYPTRGKYVTALAEGEGIVLRRRFAEKGFWLNQTGSAIWSLCDGQTSAASILDAMEQSYQGKGHLIREDAMATLMQLEQHRLLSFRGAPHRVQQERTIDLRQIPFYVINCKSKTKRREYMEQQLTNLGLQFEFVDAMESKPGHLGAAVSHLKLLKRKEFETPFGVLEDDCVFGENFRYWFTMPKNTDAFYLGVSRFGIRVPGELSWSRPDNAKWVQYDANNLRVFNMLGRHAILYLSEEFREAALNANLRALMNYDYMYPGDVGTASIQLTHLVLTPLEPICYQAAELGGHQRSTQRPLTEA